MKNEIKELRSIVDDRDEEITVLKEKLSRNNFDDLNVEIDNLRNNLVHFKSTIKTDIMQSREFH
jgi:hypothetical protein